jgi:hypothetical protein
MVYRHMDIDPSLWSTGSFNTNIRIIIFTTDRQQNITALINRNHVRQQQARLQDGNHNGRSPRTDKWERRHAPMGNRYAALGNRHSTLGNGKASLGRRSASVDLQGTMSHRGDPCDV